MLEKEIEGQILLYLEERGVFAWKNQTVGFFDSKRKIFRKPSSRFQIRGVSDILAVFSNGRLLAIEVKSKRGILRPEQRAFLERVSREGGFAVVARSLQDIKDFFTKYIDSP